MILGEPIILGGGGGIVCVVIISTEAGATVTATLENTSISKTANADGKAAFELKKAGVWTITASLNGETASTEIDTSLSLETELDFVSADPILENNTWETISKIAKKGNASQFWNVGDTKTFTADGKTYTARIIGFDHDNVANSASYGRAKAGITFELISHYSLKPIYDNTIANWESSDMRNSTLVTAYSNLEDELKSAIVPVVNEYLATFNSTTLSTITDNLFILTEAEYFGNKTYGITTEGTQYEFYAAGNSKIKQYNGTNTSYWNRTPKKDSEAHVGAVDNNGKAAYTWVADDSDGIGTIFAFCV